MWSADPVSTKREMWVETSVDVTSNISALWHHNSFLSAQQLSPKTLLVWETLKANPYRTGGCPLERHSCLCRWSIVSVRTYRVREQGGRENEFLGVSTNSVVHGGCGLATLDALERRAPNQLDPSWNSNLMSHSIVFSRLDPEWSYRLGPVDPGNRVGSGKPSQVEFSKCRIRLSYNSY